MEDSIKKSELSYVAVSDWEKARHFFINILGLKVFSSDENYNWMELSGSDEGGAMLGVSLYTEKYPSPIQPGQNAIVTFNVKDIARTKSEFESKGVKFIGAIIEIPGHVKLALFEDPDGNKFQLVEVIAK